MIEISPFMLFILALSVGLIFGGFVFFVMYLSVLDENKNAKKYKECISQIVFMLRSYNREHDDYPDIDTAVDNITDTIFTEMVQYLSDEDKIEFVKEYNKDR
jgi:hypothetical protein